MKKQFSFLVFVLLMNGFVFAQNVGIGDLAPSAKLSISGNETTLNGQSSGLKIKNTASANAWYLRAGATGTATPADGFSIGDNASYHFNMLSNGDLGLGLIPQAAKLHVNGPMKIEGLNIFEFGGGIAGKELNAGKIGYNAFGTNALAFVGAGTNSANRRVFFFAEGGTTFNGPVTIAQSTNTIGQVQLNGNPGLSGQVMTSNGAAAPTWENQAYSNNVRFSVQLEESSATTSNNCRIRLTQYNLSPADISIGTTSITINKSGLYHFDLGLTGSIFYATAATIYPQFAIWFFGGYANSFDIVKNRVMSATSTSNTGWVCDGSGSIDVYVTAPATISVYHTIGGPGTPPTISYSAEGYLTGYLIRE